MVPVKKIKDKAANETAAASVPKVELGIIESLLKTIEDSVNGILGGAEETGKSAKKPAKEAASEAEEKPKKEEKKKKKEAAELAEE